jgi:hypothetical protein
MPRAHVRPEAVQKSAASAPPAQQFWPAPPQVPAAPVPTQLPAVQVAVRPAAHRLAGATHAPPTQHAPVVPAQPPFWQQGPPAVPHATDMPPVPHTKLAPVFWPGPKQVPCKQQPPPEHALLGQQGWPAPPQLAHAPLAHWPPFWQVVPFPTHWPLPGSQHAPAAPQVLLAQHT